MRVSMRSPREKLAETLKIQFPGLPFRATELQHVWVSLFIVSWLFWRNCSSMLRTSWHPFLCQEPVAFNLAIHKNVFFFNEVLTIEYTCARRRFLRGRYDHNDRASLRTRLVCDAGALIGAAVSLPLPFKRCGANRLSGVSRGHSTTMTNNPGGKG